MGNGKGEKLTGVASWRDLSWPSQPVPVSQGTCQVSAHEIGVPGASKLRWESLSCSGSTGTGCHPLSPVPVAHQQSISGSVFSWCFTVKKTFTSCVGKIAGLRCLTAHMKPLRRCLSLLIPLQCFNCMNWKLLLQYLVGELRRALIIC